MAIDRPLGGVAHVFKVALTLIAIVWSSWLLVLGPGCALDIVADHWPVSLTMIFGSMIAGATSEGGGAVAFPVFTKLLDISPADAKVFSLAIQSVGMSAASLVIIAMRIPVEWRVVIWVSLGGLVGMLLGAGIIAPLLSPAAIKMAFTVMATSFALTLFAMNRGVRMHNVRLIHCSGYEKCGMLLVGVVGGMMSGMVGNGIDIIAFSLMVLLFRISEKIATPTSVILMSINALFGFGMHYFFWGGFNQTVQNYWLAAIPVVVVGAPLGAMICSKMSRQLIVNVLLGLIAIEFITSILIIPLTNRILLASCLVFLVFSMFYVWMMTCKRYERKDRVAGGVER